MQKKDKSGTKPPAHPQADDIAAWQHVAGGVKPLATKKTVKATPPAKTAPRASAASRPPAPALPVRHDGKTTTPPRTLDSQTAGKIRKGRIAIDATIDLHHMTQAEAERALRRFIARAVAQEHRTVLVITGKGNRSTGGGVLKRMLPVFLSDPDIARYVIGTDVSGPAHGGSGAFYLRLRRGDRV